MGNYGSPTDKKDDDLDSIPKKLKKKSKKKKGNEDVEAEDIFVIENEEVEEKAAFEIESKMFIPDDCIKIIISFIPNPYIIISMGSINQQFFYHSRDREFWKSKIIERRPKILPDCLRAKYLMRKFARYVYPNSMKERCLINMKSSFTPFGKYDKMKKELYFAEENMKLEYRPAKAKTDIDLDGNEYFVPLDDDKPEPSVDEYGFPIGGNFDDPVPRPVVFDGQIEVEKEPVDDRPKCIRCQEKFSPGLTKSLSSICYTVSTSFVEDWEETKGYCSRKCFNDDLIKMKKGEIFNKTEILKFIRSKLTKFYGSRKDIDSLLTWSVLRDGFMGKKNHAQESYDQSRIGHMFYYVYFGGANISLERIEESSVTKRLLYEENVYYKLGRVITSCSERMSCSQVTDVKYFLYQD